MNDPFKRPQRPATTSKVMPADPSKTIREHGVHGSRPENTPTTPITSRRLVTIPIDKIRAGRYQKRETIDNEKFQQLKEQIADLGFQFTAVVCIDPNDDQFYNLMMGGHIRIQAAKELGITEVQAIIRDYNRLQLAKGTYFENNGRQPLTLMEEGLMFQQLRDDEGWTQEQIGNELKVSRSHVSMCMLAAESSPDIQEMLLVDPKRGQRCFYYLRQLDELGVEKAVELRAPIIQGFLEGKISTDEVKHLVEQILRKEKGETAEEVTVEAAKGKEKVVSVYKSFQRFEKVLGDRSPSQAEREELARVRERIDAILERP